MAIFTSIIKKLEYLDSDKLESIDFIQQSASLNIKLESTSQGYLYNYSLSFKITPLSNENDIVVNKIKITNRIIATDFHDYITELGLPEYPPKVSLVKDTTGTAGGFRGYTINIDWSYTN